MPNQLELSSSSIVAMLNEAHLSKDTSSGKRQSDATDIDVLNHDIAAYTSHLTGNTAGPFKIFNDPIHGHIEMNSACLAVIDTPEFQRLRYLKQLGLVYFVYPGASHNRFEHSIGTCHLSGQFVKKLKENQPYLGIDDKDILCVQLAGLCHDLGHGPLSHLFDEKFIPSYSKEIRWKHEDASVAMFEHIIEKHGLMKSGGILRKTYELDDTDMIFVKEMIQGKSFSTTGEWNCQGRCSSKAYLYEIVSNKRNNIDVDKFDYFARDCHHLGIKSNFDHTRFMAYARVCEVNGQLQICLREKEAANLYNMFYTRWTLHRYAYQHKVKCIIETMVLDAMLLADKHLTFLGKDGKRLHLSQCIHDMEAYTQVTDDVISVIQHTTSQHPDLVEARAVINRVYCRDLYACLHETRPLKPHTAKLDEDLIREEMCALAGVTKQDDKSLIRVHITYLDFGMKNQNPVEKLNVYSKENVNKARAMNKDEASRILGPTIFSEIIVRVMSRDKRRTSEDRKLFEGKIEEAAKSWEESFGEENIQTSVSNTADFKNITAGSTYLGVNEAINTHFSLLNENVYETEIRDN